jgi:hypothetical protein
MRVAVTVAIGQSGHLFREQSRRYFIYHPLLWFVAAVGSKINTRILVEEDEPEGELK